MDLHSTIGHASHHLGGEELAAGRLGRDVLAAILAAGGLLDHAARREGLRLRVGEHRLHELELGDRLPELLAFHCIAQGIIDQPLGHADTHRRNVQPSASKTPIPGLKPLFSLLRPPTIPAAGTRTSSNITSAVCVPFCPIFLSDLPTLSPGNPASTRNAETPRASLLDRSVLANTVNRPACGALVMKRFVPLST